MSRYQRAINQEAFLRFVGEHPRDMDTPTPLPPLHQVIVEHVQRHARRFSAAGFFWTLAAYRSLRERSLRPLVHHLEWRLAWRAARELNR